MGEVLLSVFFPVVVDKLSSRIIKELGLFSGAKKELLKLRNTLLNIQDVLQDAEQKQTTEEAVRNWLEKLKEAVYDADDLLDELTTEVLRRKLKNQDGIMNKVWIFTSLSNQLLSGLKEIRRKLDTLAKAGSPSGLIVGVANIQLDASSQREPTGSFVIESKIFGRDDDKEKIVELLFATGNQENLSIIPIVATGGLGKTTIAKLVYTDPRVVAHFELRRWVYASEQFDVTRLMQKVLKYSTWNMDMLQSYLHKTLGGKKFLLVLDDISSEDHGLFERSKYLLRCGAGGSKIIITTCSETVASIWGTIEPHHLNGLSDNDCWMVFKQQAFGMGREAGENLVEIGKEMVKKCKGVPLAAKTLGSLMHFVRDENEWLSIKDSEIWEISGETSGILPALKLSYKYLPSNLKQCFAYCSIYDKSCTFEKDELIQAWMAQGFIQSCEVSREVEDNREMEDTGTEYFNDLVWRSFFEVVEKDDDGHATRYIMHDLIIDLARSIAGDEWLFVEANSGKDIPTTTRHLSLELRETSPIPGSLCNTNYLRTLSFWVSNKNIKEVPENIFKSLRRLRVLDLSGMDVKSLPSTIGELQHLRYFSLAETDIKVLPESICGLLNLQTLNLACCSLLTELPKDMSKMISLRHLDITGCFLLTHVPSKIGQLTYLQTLPIFIVCEQRSCDLGELKSLNLRGELSISKLKNVRNAITAKEAKLKEKCYLDKLRLSWEDEGEANSELGIEQVLEELQPHQSLKRLHIEDYGGENFPSWMMNSLVPNLVEIALKNCKKCQQLPPLGQLNFLRILIVGQMDAVRFVDGTVGGGTLFPLLEQLLVSNMPNLEKWWGVEGAQVVLPCLSKVTIENCPKLMTLPNSPSLEELVVVGSNSSCITSVANFNSLSYLKLDGVFPHLTCLPIGDLPNLDTLIVSGFPKLESLPVNLENLTTLKRLELHHCIKLESIPKLKFLQELILCCCERLIRRWVMEEEPIQGLHSVKNLSIIYCPNIESLPKGIQYLTALERLEIRLCPKLESLPEGLQHMTALQWLIISDSYKLVSLPEWLGNLVSLRFLSIRECPNILSMPEGLQCLTTLQDLWIEECPHLERKCDKNTGEDWHKISHIPDIFISGRKVS